MKQLIALALLATAAVTTAQAAEASYAQGPKAEAFIDKLQAKYGLDPDWVRQQLAAAERQPEILEAMRTPPEETLAWYEYKDIFLDPPRIKGGAAFIRKHAEIFQRVAKHFGVPRSIIAAIIGVETLYGEVMGDDRVLDALATLGFDYPPRSEFFLSELGQFLVLARKEGLNPQKVMGSYAGAMGMPQFIASSYRAYAVDFNDNGQRDLWHEPADIIGSVANYLAENGWQRSKPIVVPAQTDSVPERIELSTRETHYTYEELVEAGIKAKPPHSLSPDTQVGLVALEAKNGTQYWIARQNFFVITDYNHSTLYAMAVYQLSQAIADKLDNAKHS